MESSHFRVVLIDREEGLASHFSRSGLRNPMERKAVSQRASRPLHAPQTAISLFTTSTILPLVPICFHFPQEVQDVSLGWPRHEQGLGGRPTGDYQVVGGMSSNTIACTTGSFSSRFYESSFDGLRARQRPQPWHKGGDDLMKAKTEWPTSQHTLLNWLSQCGGSWDIGSLKYIPWSQSSTSTECGSFTESSVELHPYGIEHRDNR